jgi:hypothetical protein
MIESLYVGSIPKSLGEFGRLLGFSMFLAAYLGEGIKIRVVGDSVGNIS